MKYIIHQDRKDTAFYQVEANTADEAAEMVANGKVEPYKGETYEDITNITPE